MKAECVAAIEAKEKATKDQYKGFEHKNRELIQEMEELKKQLHRSAKEHEDAIALLKES